jgi:2-phospho-L-lactate guanylyltransferase
VLFALIPVKDLARAKARLAPALKPAERRELARALYLDVLSAALACSAVDGVAVVAGDPDVLSLAAEHGADGLLHPGGLNEALTSAAASLAERGVSRLVVLAADLPLARAEAIGRVVEAGSDVIVVPSRDGGTNAVALPPSVIPFRFGPDSARRHMDAAREADLRAQRLDLPALVLDIDTPEDLLRLRAVAESDRDAVGRNTLAALEKLSLVTSVAREV